MKQSLIHKSYDNNHNNEKLEFLGDRVWDYVSKKLIDDYQENEGIIDKKFANLVNKKLFCCSRKIKYKKLYVHICIA